MWPQVWASTYLRGSGHRSPPHTGASTLAPTLYGKTQYFNPDATGHFNTKGQELLGSDAAKTLAALLKD